MAFDWPSGLKVLPEGKESNDVSFHPRQFRVRALTSHPTTNGSSCLHTDAWALLFLIEQRFTAHICSLRWMSALNIIPDEIV